MSRTLIHVGMPRAASTLLQQKVFPCLAGFQHVGVARSQASIAFQQMMYQDDTLFDPEVFSKLTNDLRVRDTIISNELFVGQSLYLNATNRSRNIARLAAAFPEAEAIIVMRNQASLLASLYSIGVYAGHTMQPADFVRFEKGTYDRSLPGHLLDPLGPRYATFEPREHVEVYCYTPLLNCLQAHFTKVHVFLFEDFQSNPEAFVARFAERLHLEFRQPPALEKKVNRSLSARQLRLIRVLNHWKPLFQATAMGSAIFRRKLRFVEHQVKGGAPFRFGQELTNSIKSYYQNDNKALLRTHPELDRDGLFSKNYL